MSPLSQLFLRNEARLTLSGNVLWVNPPVDFPWRTFQTRGTPIWFTQDFTCQEALIRAGADMRFGPFPESTVTYEDIVWFVPRERERLSMMAHCASTLMTKQGRLWFAGENRGGVKSSPTTIKQHFDQVQKIDSARHCVLFCATTPQSQEPFSPEVYESSWREKSLGLKICSYPGVFAHGRLDQGTALLLETLEQHWPHSASSFLDLGCGTGVIGATLLSRNPELRGTMTDSNALALAATENTLKVNKLEAQVLASNGFGAIEGQFDVIVSNPPFHQGVAEDRNLTQRLFAPVGNFLKRGGQWIMVANRHLPYRRWIREWFQEPDILAESNTFQVLRIKR